MLEILEFESRVHKIASLSKNFSRLQWLQCLIAMSEKPTLRWTNMKLNEMPPKEKQHSKECRARKIPPPKKLWPWSRCSFFSLQFVTHAWKPRSTNLETAGERKPKTNSKHQTKLTKPKQTNKCNHNNKSTHTNKTRNSSWRAVLKFEISLCS